MPTIHPAEHSHGIDLEAALDRSRLTIVDPAWRDAVPAAWRYRLYVENP